MAKLSDEYEYDEIDGGELVEVSLQELGQLCAESPYKEETGSIALIKHENKYRFWVNTPIGLREIDRIYLRMSDLAEESADGVIN